MRQDFAGARAVAIQTKLSKLAQMANSNALGYFRFGGSAFCCIRCCC